jgi:hypothetical protein
MSKLNNPNLQKEILTLASQDMSNSEIGRRVGISNTAVNYFLKRNNINRRWKKWKYNEEFFEKIDCPEKAYILGWIASDGSINKNYTRMGISLQEKDGEVLELFRGLINSNRPLWFRASQKASCQNSLCFFIDSSKICNDLKQIGITNNKSRSIEIPHCVRGSLIKYFLRGYFEGDGCLFFNKNTTSLAFYTSSEKMADQIVFFCKEASSVEFRKKTIKRQGYKISYTIICSKRSDAIKFFEWLYSDMLHLSLFRKYQKFISLRGSIPT